MSYSYRLILLLALLLTGLPLYAQSVTEEAKSVRAMVSIVSYTLACTFRATKLYFLFIAFSSVLEDTSTGALPYLPVIIRTEQEILVSQCDGFYFGKEYLLIRWN
jgi:S-adenosylmethionine:diacylglycerol 3-amino-3-carboxypropyl transferase